MKLWIGVVSSCLFSAGIATANAPVQERFRYATGLVRYIPGETAWILGPGPTKAAALHSSGALPRLSVRISGPVNTAGAGTGTLAPAVTVPIDSHGAGTPMKQSCDGDLPK